MALLSDAERNELFSVIRDYAIDDQSWRAALSSLKTSYKQELPGADGSPARLFETLVTLNSSGHLTDGTLPMEVVLSNLRMLTNKSAVADAAAAALLTINQQSNVSVLPLYAPAGEPEAYTGASDDTLPFDFLVDGARTGLSVAKILVPRYEGGTPAHGSSGPRIFNGTVWVIGARLVVTNFHVVCARETGEDDPASGDLDLQVRGAVCHFGYDRDHATPSVVPVSRLVCHGARGGERDYAVLELEAGAPVASALRLRRQLPSVPKEGFPVNVIQHPNGNPKRVAARSNLLKSASPTKLEYFSDTLGGSSGSPLCNDLWEVIGMHRASGPATNVVVKGKLAASHNEGIPIDAILRDLEANHGGVFELIRGGIQ